MRVEEWLGAENKLGIDIWKNKYQQNDESFDDWLVRVSGGNTEIKRLIVEKKFLFGGRILASRGLNAADKKVTYSNCYVIEPPEDNLESIFECAKKLARTYSYGGGCGTDLSKLSPRGSKVRNAAKESSGAVSFMDLYSLVTGLISQNGRRGALMLSMNCDHPDIEEFIDIKKDLDRVTKANISVKVTDKFMTAVVCNDWWELKYTRAETGEVISKKVKARDLMMKLAYNNWEMGEPGVLFWDSICGDNLLSGFDDFEYAGVNPCAEEPLPAGGSCLLGSMNLSEYVVENGVFDFESFADDVFQVTIAMNKVLDEGLELHPLQEQRDSVRDWRQIGIGVMGIADMLIKMGITYGSEEAAELCEHIAEYMFNFSLTASCSLAVAKGKSFPKFDYNKLRDSHFYRDNVWDRVDDAIRKGGLYNSQLLTIAPTGTLSTMLGISGGIEPIFANSYERKTESLHGSDVYYKVYTPIVEKYMKEHGLTDESELPEFFVTARDITPKDRIRMQEAWQYYIDASISSTINLPESATPEDVLQIYIDAWHAGLKGITVFREGCKRAAILSTGSHKEEVVEDSTAYKNNHQFDKITPVPRTSMGVTHGSTYCKKCACGTLYITINRDEDGNVVETFVHTSKGGICQANLNAVNRMISLGLRSGLKVEEIVDQLKGITCPACVKSISKGNNIDGISCADILSKTLLSFYNDGTNTSVTTSKKITNTSSGEACPECGATLIHNGGCSQCLDCGWSKCSL